MATENSTQAAPTVRAKRRERPLSPHITVYRPQISSILSITHRATGVFLLIGTVFMAWWLGAMAMGPDTFAQFRDFITTPFGYLMLLGWSFSIYFHLANGIRHLFWDVGMGFELKSMHASGWGVVLFTAILTCATWYLIFLNA